MVYRHIPEKDKTAKKKKEQKGRNYGIHCKLHMKL